MAKSEGNHRKTGACLRLLDIWWFFRRLLEAAGFLVVFGDQNVTNGNIDSLENNRKQEPARGCWIFSGFLEFIEIRVFMKL
jgi:hypothetical protein